MEILEFGANFTGERRLIRGALLVQIFALLVSWTSLLFSRGRLLLLSAVISFSAISALVLLTLVLFAQYRNHPLVIEKRRLRNLSLANSAEIGRTAAVVARAARNRGHIAKDLETTLAKRQASHDQSVRDLVRKRGELEMAESNELAAALRRLQEEYMVQGLKSTLIRDAEIRGVGPKLKQRLALQGITSAFDVNRARLSGVPGFGDAKVGAVLGWRESIRQALLGSTPHGLPEGQEQSIRQTYALSISETYSQEKDAGQELERDLGQAREQAKRHEAEEDDVEAKARAEADVLAKKRTELLNSLAPYVKIDFLGYLRKCLADSDVGLRIRGIAVVGTVSVALVFGLCGNITAAVGAFGGMVVASIPTSTSTPTITPTPTSSVTYTPTSTATASLTATQTLTPSITSTASTTETPTKTPTPSVIPTATRTDTPIPSETPTPVPTVTPVPPMVRCGAICNDGTSSSATGTGACSRHGGVAQWTLCPAY